MTLASPLNRTGTDEQQMISRSCVVFLLAPTLFPLSHCHCQITMDGSEFSSPFKFTKPSDVFRRRRGGSNSRGAPSITTTRGGGEDSSSSSSSRKPTLDDFSPLKCIESPVRKNAFIPPSHVVNSPLRASHLSPRGDNASPAKRRRLTLTPVKTSQTPSPLTKVEEVEEKKLPSAGRIKKQLNFGGIFASPGKGAKAEPPETPANNTPSKKGKTPSSGRRGSRSKGSKSEADPTTPSITSIFKPIPRTRDSKKSPSTPTSSKKQATSISGTPVKPLPPDLITPRTPVDWSLKTRIRFVCRGGRAFPYRSSFRASEESTGITSFVRCLNHNKSGFDGTEFGCAPLTTSAFSPISSSQSQSRDFRREGLDTSATATLRQFTMTWTFPFLPWLPLFPRAGAVINSTGGNATNSGTPLSIPASEALCQEFVVSLRSVFHLVKIRQCPFFYICAPTFTVLFRAAGIGGIFDVIHCLVTPTTPGFRKLLDDDKISFSCPFEEEISRLEKDMKRGGKGGQSTNIVPEVQCINIEDEELDDLDDDEDPEGFLETLGLSQQDFPSLSSFSRGIPGRKTRSGGGDMPRQRDTSLVVISGPDTQSFVNLLCDQVGRICTAKTGLLAGVPPTILSPVAFSGSTLRPFKMKASSNVLVDGSTTHSIDILGPILPTHIYSLSEHFRVTQLGHFGNGQDPSMTSTTVTHEVTAPFSLINGLKSVNRADLSSCSVFLQQSLGDCGVGEQLVIDLCNPNMQVKRPIRELEIKMSTVTQHLLHNSNNY